MIAYLIKSTLCLLVLYGFYRTILQRTRMFEFNRFFLLFSVLFSLVIPFVTIKVDLGIPVQTTLSEISDFTPSLIHNIPASSAPRPSYFMMTLTGLYFSISLILIVRLCWNLIKLLTLIKRGVSESYPGYRIILVNQQVLPFTFFRNIVFSQADYHAGKINQEIISHELVHSRQYHSIDILIMELLVTAFWFNPVMWLFKKAIQLNHEFIADNYVVARYSLKNYLNAITSLVFRNNSLYLISNLNYSLTKKRINMMTNDNVSRKTILKKTAALGLILLLAVSFTFSQKDSTYNGLLNFENEWWHPILKKHNIQAGAFNNFDGVFEMGSKNSIENRIVHLEDAIFITPPVNDEYTIIRARKATHNLDKNTVECSEGSMETYSLTNNDVTPIQNWKFDFISLDLKYPSAAQESELTHRQQKLMEEQRAAAIDQKLAAEEQKKLEREQHSLAEEQKAAMEDIKLIEIEQQKLLEKQLELQMNVKHDAVLIE